MFVKQCRTVRAVLNSSSRCYNYQAVTVSTNAAVIAKILTYRIRKKNVVILHNFWWLCCFDRQQSISYTLT